MNNFKKSLLSAFSLFSFLSMAPHSAFSVKIDPKEDENHPTSTAPHSPDMIEIEIMPEQTSAKLLEGLRELLLEGNHLPSQLRLTFNELFVKFNTDLKAPRDFSDAREIGAFVNNTLREQQSLQVFSNQLLKFEFLREDQLPDTWRSDLLKLLPSALGFPKDPSSGERAQSVVFQESELNQAKSAPLKTAAFSEEKETFDTLMSTPSGRFKLRQEAFENVKKTYQSEYSTAKTSSKLGGLFSLLESSSGPLVAIQNLEGIIDQDTGWDNEYRWGVRGWAKKHNLQLIQDVKNELNGPIKAKYTPSNKN